ncbi:Golgi SNAP receptor complex member 2, variant 2 [Balamuthia mandrillaris]
MEEKYKAANKVLLDLRAQVEQLERAGENSSMGLQSQISININTLSKFTTELENMVPQQAAMRREIWRIRVQSLAEECRDLRESMGSYLQKRHVKAVEEEQRRELFEGRRRRAVGTGLESLYKEQESLGRSHHIADNIKDMGESILHNLGTQNDLLKVFFFFFFSFFSLLLMLFSSISFFCFSLFVFTQCVFHFRRTRTERFWTWRTR